MKIISYYLPQFHEIPENNKWWGKGFTEWTNVKKALPLFEGHQQPRIPLDKNYYDLLNCQVKAWQVNLAKEYGLYGFCFYHYWFDGSLLLEKPLEQFLSDKSLDFHFCLSWANEDWTNAWARKTEEVLITQKYGNESEWTRHMEYLLPFFLDRRYIKSNGKPIFIIYRPELIHCLNEMLDFMDAYAIANGLPGISFGFQHVHYDMTSNSDKSRFEHNIEYQPSYALIADAPANNQKDLLWQQLLRSVLQDRLYTALLRMIRKTAVFKTARNRKQLQMYDYDEIWRRVLARVPADATCVPGAFVDWDNTPRKGNLGFVFHGALPGKFKEYMKMQIVRARRVYKKDMIFLFAWNEWAEGGYMEPDEQNGYAYLQAMKEALLETNEFPSGEEE